MIHFGAHMFPAFSVIAFTVASGAGYGLWFFCALQLLIMAPARQHLGANLVLLSVGFLLVTAGLGSSMMHLGQPQRFWRAFSQWRSSWLSREGIASVVTYLPFLLSALFCLDQLPASFVGTVAPALALLALITVWCTAMIYRSLKTIPQWHHPIVPWMYLSLSLWTGGLLFCTWFRSPSVVMIVLVIGFVTLLVKIIYWWRIDALQPTATLESALGVSGIGRAKVFEQPHTQANYLLKEMGFRILRKHARRLRGFALGLLFAAPSILLAIAANKPAGFAWFACFAVLSSLAGAAVERWLFFAEAEHVVGLYYGVNR
jgi:sulfite dehydrogenase (quinone) subunit SoeC